MAWSGDVHTRPGEHLMRGGVASTRVRKRRFDSGPPCSFHFPNQQDEGIGRPLSEAVSLSVYYTPTIPAVPRIGCWLDKANKPCIRLDILLVGCFQSHTEEVMKRIVGRQSRDDFFDDFEKESSRMVRRGLVGAAVLTIISAALTIGVVVGCVWGVIKVLQSTGVL